MDPADIDAIRPAAEAVMSATRQEEGCIVYEFSERLDEPGVMRIYEEWESGAHLEAHFGAPHMELWREAMKGVTVRSRSLHRIEGIGSVTEL